MWVLSEILKLRVRITKAEIKTLKKIENQNLDNTHNKKQVDLINIRETKWDFGE